MATAHTAIVQRRKESNQRRLTQFRQQVAAARVHCHNATDTDRLLAVLYSYTRLPAGCLPHDERRRVRSELMQLNRARSLYTAHLALEAARQRRLRRRQGDGAMVNVTLEEMTDRRETYDFNLGWARRWLEGAIDNQGADDFQRRKAAMPRVWAALDRRATGGLDIRVMRSEERQAATLEAAYAYDVYMTNSRREATLGPNLLRSAIVHPTDQSGRAEDFERSWDIEAGTYTQATTLQQRAKALITLHETLLTHEEINNEWMDNEMRQRVLTEIAVTQRASDYMMARVETEMGGMGGLDERIWMDPHRDDERLTLVSGGMGRLADARYDYNERVRVGRARLAEDPTSQPNMVRLADALGTYHEVDGGRFTVEERDDIDEEMTVLEDTTQGYTGI